LFLSRTPVFVIFLFCSLSLFLFFSCVSTSHKWTKERSMAKSWNVWPQETANWNLLLSLEAVLQISLLCEYIKEYGTHRETNESSTTFLCYSFKVVLVCEYSRNEIKRYACLTTAFWGAESVADGVSSALNILYKELQASFFGGNIFTYVQCLPFCNSSLFDAAWNLV
jgi:hypothetical protein